ncbi:MAG: TPM domain-containing protein, partial [Rubrivivax sp.]|nr:TPM domain-containing protein [Rubrivivax sp.]
MPAVMATPVPALVRAVRRALALLLALLLSSAALAQDVLAVPPLAARVIDQTGTLKAAEAAALEAKLAAFEAEAGPQIVLLLVPATAPEDIAAYAQRVADSWKIGRREVGDGVLVVVAKDERRVRIEVAKALEGAIPDLAARQIIDNAIRPAFRADDYAGGLNAAVDQLMARIKGEALPAPAARAGARPGLQLDELAMFFFVGVPIIGAVLTGLFGRKLGSVLTAGAAGGLGWMFTASVLAGVGAALVALLLVGIFCIGSAISRAGQ